ncbi:MAG: PAS domain S-box protein, partial [Erysipelotrichia bacterium]|nr:PAS domain S-box protein [Erysipelotrichia bacterium]
MANINGGISARVFQNEDSHIVFANDNYYAMLGYTREQFQKECPHGLFDRIIKEDRQRVTAMIEHVLSSGDPENMDYRVNRRDGSVIWVRGHGSVCSFSGFKDSVFLEILVDITDQMETTQQMLFLESMAHDLLALTDSEAAVREILNRIRQFFAAERTAVFEYDGSMLNRTYVSDGCHDSKDEGISEIPEKLCSYWLSEFDQKDVAIVTDIGQIRTDHLAALLQRNSIHSLAAIPLQRNGKFIGCLSISNPQQKLKQIKHLSSLGDYVSAMLNRRDLNAAVQDENNEKLAVMNGIPGGFVRMKVKPDGSSASLYH